MRPVVALVGPQPMPRHGVSAVNEAMAQLCRSAGAEVFVFNTAPKTLDRSVRGRLSRLLPVVGSAFRLWRLLNRSNLASVYFSVSGGFGMIYELILIAIVRVSDTKVILHHHSFNYLDKYSEIAEVTFTLAGRQATHVVLCEGMKRLLTERYPVVSNIDVVSNSGFTRLQGAAPERKPGANFILGFLSNLSLEKGLWDIISMAEDALREEKSLSFEIAGPFESVAVEQEFKRRTANLGNLRYHGPLYGEAKSAFFVMVDIFLFPTVYRNEAEPLVLYEAMASGCAVISYDRGCIGAIVDDTCGALVPRDEPFRPNAFRIIEMWRKNPRRLEAVRLAAYAKVRDSASRALDSRSNLINRLIGGGDDARSK